MVLLPVFILWFYPLYFVLKGKLVFLYLEAIYHVDYCLILLLVGLLYQCFLTILQHHSCIHCKNPLFVLIFFLTMLVYIVIVSCFLLVFSYLLRYIRRHLPNGVTTLSTSITTHSAQSSFFFSYYHFKLLILAKNGIAPYLPWR